MYFGEDIEYAASEYIVTSTGNKISKHATIANPQSLEIPNGKVIIKEDAKLFCDSARITLHKYVFISEHATIKPAALSADQPLKYIPMIIGSHTYIGPNAVVEAASVGSGCWIGENAVVGPRVILKDFTVVEANAKVPADTCIPPFCSIVRETGNSHEGGCGTVGILSEQLPESVCLLAATEAVARYKGFVASSI